MKPGKYIRLAATLILPGLLLLSSCLPERKVAGPFINSPHVINLLVIPPNTIYKYNHKGESIEGFDEMSQADQDSALWNNSRFLKCLSDSLLLDNYMNSFIDELRNLGFNVYLDNAVDSFMTGKPQSYVLDVAQMQLDEYLYPMDDEETFMDTTYYKKINLNAMDFACWFDLSKANTEKAKKTTLYSTATAYDSFEGRFFNDLFTGRVHYKYNIDSLKVKDINEMATYLGKRHAGYLYDFFLNHYIAKHMPEGTKPQDYYHFSRPTKSLLPADDNRFEILDTK